MYRTIKNRSTLKRPIATPNSKFRFEIISEPDLAAVSYLRTRTEAEDSFRSKKMASNAMNEAIEGTIGPDPIPRSSPTHNECLCVV
jgi:hypothetical protein